MAPRAEPATLALLRFDSLAIPLSIVLVLCACALAGLWVWRLRRRIEAQRSALSAALELAEGLREKLTAETERTIRELEKARSAALNLASESDQGRIDAHASATRLEAILAAAGDAILTLGPDDVVETANPAAGRLFGCAPQALVGARSEGLFELDVKEHAAGFDASPAAGTHEAWILRKGRRRVPVSLSVSPILVRGRGGRVAILHDLSHRQREARRLRMVVEASPTAMVAINSSGRITLVNAQAERLFLYRREEMLGQQVELLLPEDARQSHPALRSAYFADPQQRNMGNGRELQARRKDGTLFPVEIGLNPIETDEGNLVLGAIMDLSERKEVEARLRDLAHRDALTGLLNRRGLEAAFTGELARCRRTGERIAVLLVDCDKFKAVNDTFGHTVGDLVLRTIASTLRGGLRPSDRLARIGGDEFLALLPSTRVAEAAQVAERLRLSLADRPLVVSDRQIMVTASFGIGVVPEDALTVEELVNAAHATLALSKSSGRNRVSCPTGPQQDAPAADAFDEIAAGRGISVFAQELRSLGDGSRVGYELLSRGPEGEYESPSVFFRAASERNLLTIVDVHCLKRCLAAAASLPGQHRIHINLFPSTLLELMEARLVELLERAPGRPAICVEISEQQFLGAPSYLRGRVALLRRLGAQIALDDLGFGRSSLESLVLLEPEVVKVDKCLVQGIEHDASRRRSLERTLAVARSLDAEVIAEGVETSADATVLADLGIRTAQGFLWQRPVCVLPPGAVLSS